MQLVGVGFHTDASIADVEIGDHLLVLRLSGCLDCYGMSLAKRKDHRAARTSAAGIFSGCTPARPALDSARGCRSRLSHQTPRL